MLVGRVPGSAEGGLDVLEAVPADNGAADPTTRYEISPVDYFAQIRRCRRINDQQAEHFAVIGAYHSHPHGTPEPSETDTAQAFRDFVFLIVGLGGGNGMQIGAYRLVDERLEPMALLVR